MPRRLLALLALGAIAACSVDGPGVSVGTTGPLPVETTTAPDVAVPGTTGAPGAGGATPTDQGPADGAPADGGRAVGEPWTGHPPNGLGDPLLPELGSPGLDVEHYALALTIDPGAAVLHGTVDIRFSVTADADTVAFDAGALLDIGTVTIDGATAPASHTESELVIDPAGSLVAGTEYDATIDWDVSPRALSGPDGLPLGWFGGSGGSFVLDEPNGLHSWMPANDHPSDKATWSFDLNVPAGITAVANGKLASHETVGSSERWRWEATAPMSSYLVLVMTGRFDLIDEDGPDGIAIQHAVLTELRAQTEPALALTDDMLRFFADRFGPYPFDVYGVAVTHAVPGLAMETQTRSLFDDGDLAVGEATPMVHLLLAHELAHQWFGDAVSPASWSDTWLNEGFATYGEWMWMEHAGFGSVDDSAETALRQGRGFPPPDPPADQMFDRTVYDGGGVVLHALRRELGDDSFFAVLRGWVQDHLGESRSTADFVAYVEHVTNRDLSEFFATWLFTQDPPDAFPVG